MAPTAPPKKRPTARQKAQARLADPLLPRKLHRPDNVVTDSFVDTKRDRRLIKHSVLLSKIEKSAAAAARPLKRRRPNKKLVATLESLGDALDDIVAESGGGGGGGAPSGDAGDEQLRAGKVRHRSLRSRPGALKKKEKVVKGEMERFGRSLAQLAAVGDAAAAAEGKDMEVEEGSTTGAQQATGTQTQSQAAAAAAQPSTSSRWAALRGFISATMEQNPAFVGKG